MTFVFICIGLLLVLIPSIMFQEWCDKRSRLNIKKHLKSVRRSNNDGNK